MGVCGGVDFENMGLVCCIDMMGISDYFNDGLIVLLFFMGYLLMGEVFNLFYEDVVIQVVIVLKVDKFIVFLNYDGVYNCEGCLLCIIECLQLEQFMMVGDIIIEDMVFSVFIISVVVGVFCVYCISYEKDGVLF